jgi:hypothetical protein
MHKGYKCLYISTGRVYISRDVVFYEEVFPFSMLHPNASARLKSEIALLHPILLHPHDGDKLVYGHVPNAPLTANEFAEILVENSEENIEENGHENIPEQCPNQAQEVFHGPTTSSSGMVHLPEA